jgi:hypothetical protein
MENGTHVLFGTRMADYATSEIAPAKTVLRSLSKGMSCLADRGIPRPENYFDHFDHVALAWHPGLWELPAP